MKYIGDLYGRMGRKYFMLMETTEDVEALEKDKARLDWLLEHGELYLACGLPVASREDIDARIQLTANVKAQGMAA